MSNAIVKMLTDTATAVKVACNTTCTDVWENKNLPVTFITSSKHKEYKN